MLETIILGTGGTIPLKNRWLASCLMRSSGNDILIDCGEGTQIAIKSAGYSMSSIDILCLTHCHADHISGLPGLLLTMGNESRTKPLTIIGPLGIKAAITGLLAIASIVFELDIHEISMEELESWQTPFTVGNMQIFPFPVDHDFPCAGYRVEIPRNGKFNPVKAKENNVPLPLWSKLQKNQHVEFNGVLYTQDMILDAPRKGIKVVYATDSRPVERISEEAKNADLLICEGMYGDPAKYPRAIEAHHMLFSEAATLAQTAQVKRLLLTHFSPGLDNPEEYVQYAQEIFPNASCAVDGMKEVIVFEED